MMCCGCSGITTSTWSMSLTLRRRVRLAHCTSLATFPQQYSSYQVMFSIKAVDVGQVLGFGKVAGPAYDEAWLARVGMYGGGGQGEGWEVQQSILFVVSV